ncbi:MAG: hypothetical protein V3U88_00845 [Methylococcales bacterium]
MDKIEGKLSSYKPSATIDAVCASSHLISDAGANDAPEIQRSSSKARITAIK